MNLEQKISNWKKQLRAQPHLEDGMVMELEEHLRDAIEHALASGLTEDEAFDQAKRSIGNIAQLGQQEKIALESRKASFWTRSGLLGNFFKVGRRQFRKNGLLNVINLSGLTVAFTAVFFIGLFVQDELSFERHHPDAEKIYRLGYDFTGENGVTEQRAYTSGMWIEGLAKELPVVEDGLRFLILSYGYIRDESKNESHYEEEVYWSEPNFFNFFHFDFKYGRPEDQLDNLNALILTEATAQLHFGDENPIGKPLQYIRRGISVNFIVTGVIFDPPSNSQFQPRYIAHIDAVDGIYGERNRGWIRRNPNPGYVFSFLKLSDPSGQDLVKNRMREFWNTTIPNRAEFMQPTLTRLVDIHFNPPVKWEKDNPISISYIYGLIFIGAFILTIAMTNFINLTTAQGSKRQKEIGLRKTLGSTKSHLRLQFFLESFTLTVIAMAISLGLVSLLLAEFNQLIEKNISLERILSPSLALTVGLALLVIAFFSGTFPALFFTRKLKESLNLNQLLKSEKAGSIGRNSMVVVQFAVALIMIICTITVFKQLQLINNGELGESQETVIGIRTSRMGTDIQAQRYINEIKTFSQVEATTLGMHLPRQSDFGRINTKYFVPDIDNEERFWNKFNADGGFLQTYDLTLLAGTDFRESYDTTSYIINEAAVRELGITAREAIGLFIREDSINYVFGHSDGVIIGVVKDFAYKSVKEKIEPLVIAANTRGGGVLSVRLGEGGKQATIDKLRNMWNEVYPGRPFEYWFLNKEFDRLYNQERRLGKLIPIFSGLAITIALLGLFALTAYVSELRKREIGIRKVLGCSSVGILKLLSGQYLRTISIAVVIAIPAAWLAMDYWLNNFTYRTNLSLWVILGAVLFILSLSLLTVGVKSLKAAHANPVDSLKYE